MAEKFDVCKCCGIRRRMKVWNDCCPDCIDKYKYEIIEGKDITNKELSAPNRMFRKKPVVIHAFKYTEDCIFPKWALVELNTGIITTCINGLYINTKEGKMFAPFGYYIIRGIEGEIYPCAPDIFTKTYDEVENESDVYY